MRYKTAYNLINNSCKHFYQLEFNPNYLYGLKLLKRNKRAIQVLIRYRIKDPIFDVPAYYNVGNTFEECSSNLFYISDRFNCVGRLKYLLLVIEKFG